MRRSPPLFLKKSHKLYSSKQREVRLGGYIKNQHLNPMIDN